MFSCWVSCCGGTNQGAIVGDTKAGTLIGTDRYGNKYFENMEEELPREWFPWHLPCIKLTTRWGSPNAMGGLQGEGI